MKPTLGTAILILLTLPVFSQNTQILKDINSQVWHNFTKSFETLDYNLFSDLHSDDLIRVGGDNTSLKSKRSYIEEYKKRWKASTTNQTISFRFLERICNNEKASERGIYKLTRNTNSPDQKSYYGKFHVILKKEDNRWKILVDYDSSENNTINETSYNQAFSLDDFARYGK